MRTLFVALSLSVSVSCGSGSSVVLSDLKTIAESPSSCQLVHELDSDPAVALVCAGLQGIVTAALGLAAPLPAPSASMTLASARSLLRAAPVASAPPVYDSAPLYRSIVVPGDSSPAVHLRSDLWTADREAAIVVGIRRRRTGVGAASVPGTSPNPRDMGGY